MKIINIAFCFVAFVTLTVQGENNNLRSEHRDLGKKSTPPGKYCGFAKDATACSDRASAVNALVSDEEKTCVWCETDGARGDFCKTATVGTDEMNC